MPHLRVAASEAAFKKLFVKVVDKFVFEKAVVAETVAP